MPAGNGEAVVIEIKTGAALIVIDRILEAICEPLSIACTVKFDMPATVGVPLIAPVNVLKLNPVGRAGDTE